MNQYNAYESSFHESHTLNRSGLDKQNTGKGLVSGLKGSNKGPIKATPMPQPQPEYMNTIQVEQNNRVPQYSQHYDQPGQRQMNHGGMHHALSGKSEHVPLNMNRKPPVSKGSLNSLNQQQMQQQMMQQRAQSVSANMQLSDTSMTRDNFQTPKKSWNATDEKTAQ